MKESGPSHLPGLNSGRKALCYSNFDLSSLDLILEAFLIPLWPCSNPECISCSSPIFLQFLYCEPFQGQQRNYLPPILTTKNAILGTFGAKICQISKKWGPSSRPQGGAKAASDAPVSLNDFCDIFYSFPLNAKSLFTKKHERKMHQMKSTNLKKERLKACFFISTCKAVFIFFKTFPQSCNWCAEWWRTRFNVRRGPGCR